MTLKLAQLPDRAPVKLLLKVEPKLLARLNAYASLYEATYGKHEATDMLATKMLELFLDGDPAFRRQEHISAAKNHNNRNRKRGAGSAVLGPKEVA